MPSRFAASAESGQAIVESAVALPLQIFLVLGILQLFLMLQARIMAEYAVFRAVRAGAVSHGECEVMAHAAIAALLPTLTHTGSPAEVGAAFGLHRANRYVEGGHTGQIIELVRESPDPATVPTNEDLIYDQPPRPLTRLEVRMLYWYRLRVPFADWVVGRMLLAHFGVMSYRAANPLMPTQSDAHWVDGGARFSTQPWPGGSIPGNLSTWAGQGHYLFPIEVNASMRMMVPPKKQFFPDGQFACPI